MKLRKFVKKEGDIYELRLNDKYFLFIEKLEYVDNEEDILIELFDNEDFIANCMEFIPHCFKSNANIKDIIKYGFKCIEAYENDK